MEIDSPCIANYSPFFEEGIRQNPLTAGDQILATDKHG